MPANIIRIWRQNTVSPGFFSPPYFMNGLDTFKRGKTMNAPKDLGTKGKAFWQGVMNDWELEKAHEIELLHQAGICLDRIENAREALAKEGEYLTIGERVIVHPAIKTEKELLALFFRAIRDLDLTEIEPEMMKKLKKGRGM